MANKEERFKEIIRENESKIQRISRYYASSEEESKDICQEVLVNIWKSLDTFRGDSLVSTWIYRIAVNTALSICGKTIRKNKLLLNVDATGIANVMDDAEGQSEDEYSRRLDAFHSGINQLGVIDKMMISLVMEDLSMKEIAQIVGLTEPNVRVKIHRIKESLKESVAAQLAD